MDNQEKSESHGESAQAEVGSFLQMVALQLEESMRWRKTIQSPQLDPCVLLFPVPECFKKTTRTDHMGWISSSNLLSSLQNKLLFVDMACRLCSLAE